MERGRVGSNSGSEEGWAEDGEVVEGVEKEGGVRCGCAA